MSNSNVLSKGLVQARNLAKRMGTRAIGVLRVAANVADTQTVTIGSQVWEFDRAANGVTAGRIAVTGHADDTPDNATTALVSSINTNNTSAVTAEKISANEILLYGNQSHNQVTALAESLAGANNVWAAAAMAGGTTPAVAHFALASRVPTATEVALGTMHFLFDFTPSIALVFVMTTATGVQVLWNGSVTIAATPHRVTLDNGSTVDWSANETVTVLALG